jgi:competence protein ComEA
MWVTEQERRTLIVLGGSAVLGLSVVLWQQQRPAISVAQGPTPPYTQWQARVRQSSLVDINQATVEELMRLPQIGPSLAQRIVAYREAHGGFEHPEQLRQVPGIGPKIYASVKDYIATEQ